MNKRVIDHIKLFGMSYFMIDEELKNLESEYNLDLGYTTSKLEQEESNYYSQFELSVRAESNKMSQHYKIFYCLERTIRKLIAENLDDEFGSDWWSLERIPEEIINNVKGRIKKENNSVVTRRSEENIDYTTFGELSEIIIHNWDVFGGTLFNSKEKVRRVMSNLNNLRAPIAHSCPITDDEAIRLSLTVKDWFRTMS